MTSVELWFGRLTVLWHQDCGPCLRHGYVLQQEMAKHILQRGRNRQGRAGESGKTVEALMVEQPRSKPTWVGVFLCEVISMPRRHVFVFLAATVVAGCMEPAHMGRQNHEIT